MESKEIDDKANMFKEALRCINGNIDFAELATRLGVANAEAMRKRFKRAFEKDPEGPINIKGNQLGGQALNGSTPTKPSNSPVKSRKKTEKVADADANEEEEGEDTNETKKTPTSAGKKRKTTKANNDSTGSPKKLKSEPKTKDTIHEEVNEMLTAAEA